MLPGIALIPLGYVQVTDVSAAVALANIPADANFVLLEAETQDIRWRDDGIDPAAGVGMVLTKGVPFEYTGTIKKLKFIQTTATAKLNVSYYKMP